MKFHENPIFLPTKTSASKALQGLGRMHLRRDSIGEGPVVQRLAPGPARLQFP